MKKTKQIRIEKDAYAIGYYTVYLNEYIDGKLVYQSVLDYFKKKTDAEKFRRLYK